jgi:syntaxin 6
MGEDHQAEWARQEQQVRPFLDFRDAMLTFVRQMMIQQQDQTISSIAGTLSTIAQQAGLMGSEISEHNECAASLLF